MRKFRVVRSVFSNYGPGMEWLNYHHLLYFWMVAKHGGIAKAGRELRLRPPTLSAQIRRLEDALGEKLFAREGRKLVPTELGRVVYGYADDIFSLGREMLDTVKGRGGPKGLRLVVGVADAVPKLVALRLLRPALALREPLRIVCVENRHEKLVAGLALHELDVVISDAPTSSALGVRAFNHLLGECGISFFAGRKVAERLRGRFPKSLEGAPFLLPTEDTALRRSLDTWFDAQGLRPRVAGEFEDSALLEAFGRDGAGVFASPTVIEREIARQHDVRVLGRTEAVRERFYAISAERRLRHPAVVALTEAARERLFH
jgi:LysR family transcriptional regulator, transcriptional activator of nhaA